MQFFLDLYLTSSIVGQFVFFIMVFSNILYFFLNIRDHVSYPYTIYSPHNMPKFGPWTATIVQWYIYIYIYISLCVLTFNAITCEIISLLYLQQWTSVTLTCVMCQLICLVKMCAPNGRTLVPSRLQNFRDTQLQICEIWYLSLFCITIFFWFMLFLQQC